MGEYRRQWQEQEAGPKKQRFPPSQILAWAGPLLPVSINLPWELEEEFRRKRQPYVRPAHGLALIDTGATYSAFDQSAITKLGLQPTGVTKGTTGSSGRRVVKDTYAIRFSFPGTPLPDFPVRNASAYRLSVAPHFIPQEVGGKVIALLARDFLQYFTLRYDGPSGEFVISWDDGIASEPPLPP
jgi:hypothetical protein